MVSNMTRGIGRFHHLNPATTAFFLCDIQEAFRKAMPLFPSLIANASKLINAGDIFKIPLYITEQYPEKLGPTVEEFKIKHAKAVLAKTKFSMMIPEMHQKLFNYYGQLPRDVVLFGIETHVCVEQTAMDLLANNVNVFLVADCTSSRLNQDRNLAFQRMNEMGCVITTSENVIFNILQDKKSPFFQRVRKLVAEPSADMKMDSFGEVKMPELPPEEESDKLKQKEKKKKKL